MATPKGIRAVQLSVNETDAVHVYSDDQHIWIQLRRDVRTERDIGTPSFKTALCLAPSTAEKLGSELLKLAARNKGKQMTKAAAPPHRSAKQAPVKPNAPQNDAAPTNAAVKQAPMKSEAPRKDAALCPRCRKPTIQHEERQWCVSCGGFTTGRTSYPRPSAQTQKPSKKPVVVDLISKRPKA